MSTSDTHMEEAAKLWEAALEDGTPDAAILIATALSSAHAEGVKEGMKRERERCEDKIDGLSSDLDNAVETAFKRGATEWCRLNYPKHYERFTRLSNIDEAK